MPPLLAFARARPQNISISETYSYQQVISHLAYINPDPVHEPAGKIDVVIPYDGYQYFTGQSRSDVVHQLGQLKSTQPVQALIGHLTVASFGSTHLSQTLDLRGTNNSVPIEIPVVSADLNPAWLGQDRRTCVLSATYKIEEPGIWPIDVDIRVRDEDILNPSPEQSAPCANATELRNMGRTISSRLNARRDLCLTLVVTATVLGEPSADAPLPMVTRCNISWPSVPSMHTVRAFVGEGEQATETPLRYDPIRRRLEWRNVSMTLQEVSQGAGLLTFRTPSMRLRADQPGDLARESDESGEAEGATSSQTPSNQETSSQDHLFGEVEVEIPGWLFSGLDVRYFNALGRLDPQVTVQRTTKLRSRFRVVLDDVFAERILSPRQHLFFDQVIPDGMRWLDIEGALNDRGFRPEGPIHLQETEDGATFTCCAKRAKGAFTLWLVLVADGRRHTTRRETQIPGGQRYTSIIESGDLTVHLAAEMPGDSQALTEEMNALQAALRERFDRLKSMR